MKVNEIRNIIEKERFEIFEEETEKCLAVHRNHRLCGKIFKEFGECKITDCDRDYSVIRITIKTK